MASLYPTLILVGNDKGTTEENRWMYLDGVVGVHIDLLCRNNGEI